MSDNIRRQWSREGQEHTGTGAMIGVVGLGYVGLRLAHVFNDVGHPVLGFDVDDEKLRQLRSGVDPIHEVGSRRLEVSSVSYTDDPTDLQDCDYVLLSVPTPVDGANDPDLSYVEAAGETVGANLTTGTTVVLESTVYPGATREVLMPVLESASGLVAGEDFSVGYSPERVVPGEGGREFRDIVKIVSGQDERTARRLRRLYERPLDAGVHVAPTIETAEAAKCLENVQRDLNIGLINEFAMGCNEISLDIDPYDVLGAAGTKWNFHQYRPGLVGGHCLPADPYFIMAQFERKGYAMDLPRVARQVNERVPEYVVARLLAALERRNRSPETAERVLMAGLAYKPEASDIRFSPVRRIIAELRERQVDVVGYEPHADADVLRGEIDIPIQRTFSTAGFDALVVPTAHRELRQLDLDRVGTEMNDDPVLVDVARAFDEERATDCGFTYLSL